MFETDYRPEDLRGTGRHLSKRELWAWTRFLDAARLMEEVLAHHVTKEHGMSHSDYEVLVRLDGAGGAMRMSVLASQVVSSRQKLYSTVNRLERRGWIRREATPEDGRGALAILTDEGGAALTDAAAGHAELIKQFLLDPLTADEQRALGETLQRVAAHLRVHRAGEACLDCDG